ncbi:MAG: glycosyltransferase family 39 protein, partial [Methanosarcina sp.]
MLIRLNNLRWWAKLECASREKVVLVASLFVFFLAWTCSWAILEADRSLHFDVLEAYAWGREFQLGYDKHGPFWSWVAGAWFSLFPNTNTCFVLLEASNATLGLLGAWRLNGLFVTGRMRDAAVLLLLVTPFYTFQAYKYNANTIFISLWPWTLFFFVRSLDKGRKWDAALFGVFAAALLLSKYYAVVLLLTCALALPFHEQWRRYILSPLPWIAGVMFAALALPHLIWTIKAGAPTVAYAISKTGKGWLAPIIHGGQFLIWVVLSQSGVLL